MDPRHTGDIFKHLDKQGELLMEAYRSMSHDLHRLQVEEEMLMRKFYEIMTAHGKVNKLPNGNNVSNAGKNRDSTELVVSNSDQDK